MRLSAFFDGSKAGAALLGVALAVAACAPQPEPAGSDTAAKPTFVSLNPCLDALLVELADDDQILALSHYSRNPASSSIDSIVAARHGVTGGSAEEVLALQADIVLASTFMSPATRTAFERLGLRVETFGSPTSIDESLDQVRRLAVLTGDTHPERLLVNRIETIAERTPPETTVATMLWQPGQIVPGERTLIGQLLRLNGFTNATAERGLEQADFVALEDVLAHPPELLLVAGGSAGQRNPALARLDTTRVEPFDPQLIYCGGPTIIAADERLRELRAEMIR
ncbi:ABC transporter substrate-binding protein [Erythrobacter sp. GH1-10]|uniref:ABC transporter substrate-binding protein n=1 Tax=Erythrobacter sp. GH1-10 TaxID=3349334 RepID=UPI00387805DD